MRVLDDMIGALAQANAADNVKIDLGSLMWMASGGYSPTYASNEINIDG